MPEKEKKADSGCCRHGGGCPCLEGKVVRNGQQFCCDSCADGTKTGPKCSCGHPACSPK
ncbi:MAG: hypothetical protein ABI584_12555 [Acidobacteriota bacterium]